MKSGLFRVGILILAFAGVGLDAAAATPICSVYLESLSTLQKLFLLGAQAYQSPQLGALPMLMSAGLPGAAQMSQEKPVALHVLDLGGGKTGMVIEVFPAGEVDAYLKALAGAEAALPVPVDGIYTLGRGMAAKVAGNRLLLVPKAENAAQCLSVGQLPEMPALPGVLRISLSPAALAPMLDNLKKTMAAMPAGVNPQADKGARAMSGIVDFYRQMLSQIEAMHLGLNMQQEGIFIRTRLAPKQGSDMAAVLSSGKPLSAAQLGFIEKNSLISYTTGGCTIPDRLKQQLVGFYTQMTAMSPLYKPSQTNDIAAVMNRSIRMLGAPMAFTSRLAEDGGALLALGAMGVADPAAYLKEQVEIMKAPGFLNMMEPTGMKFPAPTTRQCKGVTVYSWKTEYDEAAMKEAARAALPANMPAEKAAAALESSLASMRMMMNLFGKGYDYAAMPKDVVFGMGSPAMIEAAIDRVGTAAKESEEAARIEAVLAPSGAPYTLGRISLSKLMGLILAAQPELAAAMKGAQAAAVDEGIVFAAWPYKQERLTALLIPASDVKAISSFAQAAQAQAMQKRQGGAAPARAPVPDNF
jgi:hypothetical protein